MTVTSTNGNGRRGIVGSLAHLGETVVMGLPPAFLILLLLNVCFLGMVMWFLNGANEQRLAFATKLVDACIVVEQQRR